MICNKQSITNIKENINEKINTQDSISIKVMKHSTAFFFFIVNLFNDLFCVRYLHLWLWVFKGKIKFYENIYHCLFCYCNHKILACSGIVYYPQFLFWVCFGRDTFALVPSRCDSKQTVWILSTRSTRAPQEALQHRGAYSFVCSHYLSI